MVYAHFNCSCGFSLGAALAALIGAGADVEYINSRIAALNLVPGRVGTITGRTKGVLYTGLQIQPTTGGQYPAVGLAEKIRDKGLDACAADRFARVVGVLEDYYNARITAPFFLSGTELLVLLGTLLALEILQVDKLFVSPLPLGGADGRRLGAHINVMELLNGFVVSSSPCREIFITPPGAALIKCLAESDQQMPEFTVQAAGCGGEVTNSEKSGDGQTSISFQTLVNVVVGEPVLGGGNARKACEEVLLMETAIDDMNPEFFPYLVNRLLKSGALDAYLKPIIMKKGRPGNMLTVLARKDRQDALLRIIFSETTTLGVRLRTEWRACLQRDFVTVQTDYGPVQVKLALDEPGGQILRYAPEFEDCRARAQERSVPLQNVYRAAMLVADKIFNKDN